MHHYPHQRIHELLWNFIEIHMPNQQCLVCKQGKHPYLISFHQIFTIPLMSTAIILHSEEWQLSITKLYGERLKILSMQGALYSLVFTYTVFLHRQNFQSLILKYRMKLLCYCCIMQALRIIQNYCLLTKENSNTTCMVFSESVAKVLLT